MVISSERTGRLGSVEGESAICLQDAIWRNPQESIFDLTLTFCWQSSNVIVKFNVPLIVCWWSNASLKFNALTNPQWHQLLGFLFDFIFCRQSNVIVKFNVPFTVCRWSNASLKFNVPHKSSMASILAFLSNIIQWKKLFFNNIILLYNYFLIQCSFFAFLKSTQMELLEVTSFKRDGDNQSNFIPKKSNILCQLLVYRI